MVPRIQTYGSSISVKHSADTCTGYGMNNRFTQDPNFHMYTKTPFMSSFVSFCHCFLTTIGQSQTSLDHQLSQYNKAYNFPSRHPRHQYQSMAPIPHPNSLNHLFNASNASLGTTIPPSAHDGVVIGLVFGSITIFCLLIAAFWYGPLNCKKWRRDREEKERERLEKEEKERERDKNLEAVNERLLVARGEEGMASGGAEAQVQKGEGHVGVSI